MNILNKLGLQRIPKLHIESNETAEKITRISETLIDLQKLAIGKIDIINLQTGTQCNTISITIGKYYHYSLTDDDLDTIKRILDVSDSGSVSVVDDSHGNSAEIETYSTKIPTVKYVRGTSICNIHTALIFESPLDPSRLDNGQSKDGAIKAILYGFRT
jgi:hypothetical protein